MLVIKNEAQFTKKAKGRITFRCTQGLDIDKVLQTTIESGAGQTITLTAEGRDEVGDIVATFSFLWSIKQKI